ncbi:MAG: carboxypeptidase-like regulatory domain-containing protein [Gemmatimonadota bacterium]
MRKLLIVVCASMLAASVPVGAQQLRGTVRDSASRRPVTGAVITLFDSVGKPIMRGVSNAHGIYDIPFLGDARRGRVVRLGYRPRDIRLPGKTGTVTELNLSLTWLPTLLEPVVALANPHCPRRRDAAATQALLEQARAGLLTSVVQRESDPPSLILYNVERNMEGTSSRIKFQDVRRDSVGAVPRSFVAVYSATDFLTRGFMQNEDTGPRYFAPDAEVLLDDQFTLGYCFRIMDPAKARPRQIGLGFRAADSRRDRIDIDGAVWIDTAARELRDIDYRYVGFPWRIQTLDPGGRINFRELTDGQTLIDTWTMRIIGARYDTVRFAGGYAPRIEETLFAFEKGGQVAHATWSDGRAWHAPLGKLRLHVRGSEGRIPAGTEMYMPYTPYRAVVDSSGMFAIDDLISGRYSLLVIDPRLAPLNLDIPTTFDFLAANDSTHAGVLRIQTAEEWAIARCEDTRQFVSVDTTLVFGRIFDLRGLPVPEVDVTVTTDALPVHAMRTKQTLSGRFVGGFPTGTDGIFEFCGAKLDATITAHARKEKWKAPTRRLPVTGHLTIVPLVIEPNP